MDLDDGWSVRGVQELVRKLESGFINIPRLSEHVSYKTIELAAGQTLLPLVAGM